MANIGLADNEKNLRYAHRQSSLIVVNMKLTEPMSFLVNSCLFW